MLYVQMIYFTLILEDINKVILMFFFFFFLSRVRFMVQTDSIKVFTNSV